MTDTKAIDHAAEARGLLAFVGSKAMTSEQALASIAAAQANATLALVEQQRIANLIALAGQGSDSFETALPILRDEAAAALMEFVRSEATQITDAEDFPETRPEIKKGLGL